MNGGDAGCLLLFCETELEFYGMLVDFVGFAVLGD